MSKLFGKLRNRPPWQPDRSVPLGGVRFHRRVNGREILPGTGIIPNTKPTPMPSGPPISQSDLIKIVGKTLPKTGGLINGQGITLAGTPCNLSDLKFLKAKTGGVYRRRRKSAKRSRRKTTTRRTGRK